MDAIFDTVCGPSPSGCDVAGAWIGVLLTILVLTFLVKDMFLFRLAQSLLVGTAIGFGSAVILRRVLVDQLLTPLLTDFMGYWPLALVLLFGLLLLLKLTPWGSSVVANIPLGILFGVGAALAIGGALNSVLTKQVGATIDGLKPQSDLLLWANGLIVLVGVVGAFLSFRFTSAENNPALRLYSRVAGAWGRIGIGFIMIAFGAILANVLIARIATLVGQLYFILNVILNAFGYK